MTCDLVNSILALSCLLVPLRAAAQSGQATCTVTVSLDEQGKVTACEGDDGCVAGGATRIKIQFSEPGRFQDDLTFTETDGATYVIEVKEGQSFPRTASDASTLTGPAGSSCRVVIAAGGSTSPLPLATAARRYLDRFGLDTMTINKTARARRIPIYHLPDGTPAYTIPARISEKDTILVRVVYPTSARQVGVDVTSCGDAPGFRVRGMMAEAAEYHRGRQRPSPPRFAVYQLPRELRCADRLVYTVHLVLEDGNPIQTQTEIAIDPVYRFSWGVSTGFDFGKPSSVSLKDRSKEGGGTEKFIAESNEYSGVRPFITLGLHLCGANPRDWNWCDWLMPTLALDPTRPVDGFAFGLTLAPLPEVGLTVAATLFRSRRLEAYVKEKPGDAWTAAGDLPTKSVFDESSFGAFIGLNVTTDVLKALFGKK